jgi:hypothetical protein
MSSLSEFASRNTVPDKAWTPRVESTGTEALVISKPYHGEQKHDDLMRENGFDPEEYELDGPVAFNRRELVSGEEVVSYRFKVRKRADALDLKNAFAAARNAKAPKPLKGADDDRALVVVLADVQAGKVASRGGTPEMLHRVYTKLDKLRLHAKARKCSSAVLLEAGDVIENVQNVKSQIATNDASLTDQLDIANTIEIDFIKVLAELHSEVMVAGVPSNHSALRAGKDLTDTVNDDYGLMLLRFAKKALALAPEKFGHVSFFEPAPYRESLTLDVKGVGVGLVHGHQARPTAFEAWLAGQVNGNAPLATAEVIVAGHYHHLKVQPVGRSMSSDRTKWFLQAPTLDNGSDWWTNIKGSDSDPGLLVFEVVRGHGLDIQSLTVL